MLEDESEEPSRVGTPAIVEEKAVTMAESNAPAEAGGSGEGNEKAPQITVQASPKAPELPPEVRTKLRKLEKLESKYQGRVDCWPRHVDPLTVFRTPTILPNCTRTSYFNRTIREGFEGTYASSHNW